MSAWSSSRCDRCTSNRCRRAVLVNAGRSFLLRLLGRLTRGNPFDVIFAAFFAHQVPTWASHSTVSTISGPTTAIISATVVTFAASRAATARVSHPHVVCDRVLEVMVAHFAQLAECFFFDLDGWLWGRPSLDEAVSTFVSIMTCTFLRFPVSVTFWVSFSRRWRWWNVKRTCDNHLKFGHSRQN